MNGKGIFIWKAKNSADGSVEEIVQACLMLGLRWAALKIGDAASIEYASFADMRQAVTAFKAAGISVWGWHYVYGGVWIGKDGVVHVGGPSPVQEADFAKRWVQALGLDGYIIDAEREWKISQQAKRATKFINALTGIGCPVALSSYRFPSLHREFPWEKFLAGCDLHMPQVYWGPGRAVIDLDRSIQELSARRMLPVVPTGRAYIGNGYPEPGPGKDELDAFLNRAVERGCPGASFWALDFLYLHNGGQERSQAIADFKWGEQPPAPERTQPPAVLGKIRVTAQALNVRLAPSIQGRDVGDLVRGTEMYVFGEYEGWAMIGDGAWISTGAGLAEWSVRYAG